MKRYEPPLRIDVLAGEEIDPQARTYAEYLVFAALTQAAEATRIRRARVVLRRRERDDGGEGVLCAVTVAPGESSSLHVRANGSHPYAAINRAVQRLKVAVGIVAQRTTPAPASAPAG